MSVVDQYNHILQTCPSCNSKEVDHRVLCGKDACLYIPLECESCGHAFPLVTVEEAQKRLDTLEAKRRGEKQMKELLP